MGKKLTVYMIDGTEFGPRYAEIGNWVGKAFYSSRVNISSVLNREEFDNPGVYCLKSRPYSTSFSERVYIGEAENIRQRIKTHLNDNDRDFEECIFFISKDELLTKTQIKFLEAKLITLARESRAAEIDNTQSPTLPTLHEADISDMDFFLEQMKLIFPVMGFNFLKSVVVTNDNDKQGIASLLNPTLFKIKNTQLQIEAYMYENEKGFVVTKGSLARKQLSNSITDTYRRLQNKLIESGILVELGDRYCFTEDTIFSSPSAASNIVLGRQSAGTIEWLTEDGKTYKEVTGY